MFRVNLPSTTVGVRHVDPNATSAEGLLEMTTRTVLCVCTVTTWSTELHLYKTDLLI